MWKWVVCVHSPVTLSSVAACFMQRKKNNKKPARGGVSRNPDTVISIANCFSRGRGAALNCVYVVKSRLLTRQVTDTFHGLGVSYIR